MKHYTIQLQTLSVKDNDSLSSRLAAELNADLIIFPTDINGKMSLDIKLRPMLCSIL